ncbi:hypothetical protein BDN72DRAFT_85029 [Pluteus cervinus]|uniref:Uncharacterized protein n=1 Tax=Pluteus cervinus TaxID=181527 RepID=A0ACD3AQV9_9AGAR|nr:hypothetical protein BDN72DRAFT_85029 [Pluteus cervinus]
MPKFPTGNLRRSSASHPIQHFASTSSITDLSSHGESPYDVYQASPPMEAVFQAVPTGRKSYRTLRERPEAIWPPSIEAALLDALQKYRPNSVCDPKRLRRFPKRNRFISEHIFKVTGKTRTPKQVGSRLQQLRETCDSDRVQHLLSRREYSPEVDESPATPSRSGSILIPPKPTRPSLIPPSPSPTVTISERSPITPVDGFPFGSHRFPLESPHIVEAGSSNSLSPLDSASQLETAKSTSNWDAHTGIPTTLGMPRPSHSSVPLAVTSPREWYSTGPTNDRPQKQPGPPRIYVSVEFVNPSDESALRPQSRLDVQSTDPIQRHYTPQNHYDRRRVQVPYPSFPDDGSATREITPMVTFASSHRLATAEHRSVFYVYVGGGYVHAEVADLVEILERPTEGRVQTGGPSSRPQEVGEHFYGSRFISGFWRQLNSGYDLSRCVIVQDVIKLSPGTLSLANLDICSLQAQIQAIILSIEYQFQVPVHTRPHQAAFAPGVYPYTWAWQKPVGGHRHSELGSLGSDPESPTALEYPDPVPTCSRSYDPYQCNALDFPLLSEENGYSLPGLFTTGSINHQVTRPMEDTVDYRNPWTPSA